MIKGFVPKIVVATVVTAVLAAAAAAQPPAPPPFQPGLGDLMTAFVQPRHIKLGLGGQARNWEYAAYEWDELNETFQLIEKQVPRYHDIAMSDLLQMVKEPMSALQAAIKARDGGQFDAAYGRLTDGCNACHQSTDHKMVVVQVPRAAMFPDQNFAPQKP
jgi:hypothetical protein